MSKNATKSTDKKTSAHKEPTKEIQELLPELTAYGKFEFQNKITYIGTYKQLSSGVKVREGMGKVIHPSHDNSEFGQEYYEGEWKDDKMEGMGIYQYSNGDRYEGEWHQNMHSGNGKYFFTDGSRYEGEWIEHRMDGAGKYWDINGVLCSGEFRKGNYFSKDQAKLKEEKRFIKKLNKLKEVPFSFMKQWEDIYLKVDKKNAKDLLSPFFAKIDTMGIYVKENYPKLEDKTPDKWNEAIKFVLNISNKPIINVPVNSTDLIILDKSSLLTPQLQKELSSGQVIEIIRQVEQRTIKLVIAYNKDINQWLIVYFMDQVDKKK